MKLLMSALTDKDLCNVLIVMVLAMFPMFVRGPRSVSFVHSLSMVHALDQECVQIAERAMILAIKAVTSSRKSKKHYYCLQQNILALGMLKNCYLNDLTQLQYRISIQSLSLLVIRVFSQLQDLKDLRQYSQRHHKPPLVGLLEPPLVGLLEPPLVGLLEPPLVVLLEPPLVGLLWPPLVGILGPPLVGILGPPLVGLLGPPLVGLLGSPLVRLLGPPLVGLLGPSLVGLSWHPLVGLLGPLLVGLPVSPLLGQHHHLWKHPRSLRFPRVLLITQGFGLSLRALLALWLGLGLCITLIIFLCQDLYLTFRTYQTPMKILKFVVHKTMDAEEVESIAVGQKRARSPSSPHSNSHSLGRKAKSKTGRANEGPSNKKSAIEPKI